MGYEELDWFTTASAPAVWVSASYAYDPVDNLLAATVRDPMRLMTLDAFSDWRYFITGRCLLRRPCGCRCARKRRTG